MPSIPIDDINRILASLESKNCVGVWRSIGTNIFFEYGIPTIKRIKPLHGEPFTVVRGQVAIGIHAEDWFLSVESKPILNSEIVDGDNISIIGKEFFIGKPMPKFSLSPERILHLAFEGDILFRIEENKPYNATNQTENEVTLYLQNGDGYDFNYERGFYSSEL